MIQGLELAQHHKNSLQETLNRAKVLFGLNLLNFEDISTEDNTLEPVQDPKAKTSESNFWGTKSQLLSLEKMLEKVTVPENEDDFPNLFIFLSPSRSGSTGLWLTTISNPEFHRIYFQLIKGIQRGKIQETSIPKGNKLLVHAKATFAPYLSEMVDVVDFFRQLGFPPQKINVMYGLRKPEDTFLSMIRLGVKINGNEFNLLYQTFVRSFLNELLTTSKNKVFSIAALDYELLSEHDPSLVLKTLLKRKMPHLNLHSNYQIGFPSEKEAANDYRIEWGEADPDKYPTYYKEIIASVLEGKSYMYRSSTNKKEMLKNNQALQQEVEIVGKGSRIFYEEFRTISLAMLGIDS